MLGYIDPKEWMKFLAKMVKYRRLGLRAEPSTLVREIMILVIV